MKTILLASAFCIAAAAASASGPSDPIIEPEIIVTETVKASGSDDWVVLFMVAITFGTALLN